MILFVLFLPIFVFADKSFDDGKKIANDYIYSLPEYSRYLLSSGNLPFGYDSNGVAPANGFSTGGFLNELEFRKSKTSNVSWLSPGIQYWLTNGKALDLMIRENVVSSGVRVSVRKL